MFNIFWKDYSVWEWERERMGKRKTGRKWFTNFVVQITKSLWTNFKITTQAYKNDTICEVLIE